MSWVSSWPARPTNGSPWRSSCWPGPSPTNMQLRVGAPDAEHHLRAARGELAQRATGGDRRDLGERGAGAVRGMRETARWDVASESGDTALPGR